MFWYVMVEGFVLTPSPHHTQIIATFLYLKFSPMIPFRIIDEYFSFFFYFRSG